MNGQSSTEIPGLSADGYRILHYASLAPSGHNSQHWFVRINTPDHWTIGLDHDRRLPVVDGNNTEALLSIGAFLENLVQAAAADSSVWPLGRRFQRMALEAKNKMTAIHPMSQTLGETRGRKHITENHSPGTIPHFMLLVGYLDKYPDPVSVRRPVAWFVRT